MRAPSLPLLFPAPPPPETRARRRGFTLIELMTVMAIAIVIMATAVPAVRGTLEGINLTGAAEALEGQLSLARQTALSRSLPVEVRFYQDSTYSANPWRIVGMVIPSVSTGKTSDEWLSPPSTLPGSVIIDSTEGKDFSTILTHVNTTAPTSGNPNPSGPWAAKEADTAPRKVRGKNYIAFRFQSNGSTNLTASADATANQAWSISLKNLKDQSSGSGTTPAANYVAIVIDPLTGRTLSYRP